MYMHGNRKQLRGFSLVEVVIVVSITALVFTGLFASFQYSLKLINLSRAKLSAISVANDRMEYFRSLPYSDVGVMNGFPSGTIPQNSTTTLNGIHFAEKVRVTYVDAPEDGDGASDSNAISTDYKQVRLEYSWTMGGIPGNIVMVSNIVPRSIETSVGGGTVRINVLDDSSQLIPGASVRVFNTALGYDVTALTDVTGTALFSVPAGSGYETVVTGPIAGHAYSIDSTYVASVANPTPVLAPFTVLEADVSTLTFQIGRLSNLLVHLYSDIQTGFYREDFSDLTAVASSTLVMSNGSAVTLLDTAGVYSSVGTVYVAPVAPVPLARWEMVTVTGTAVANTSYRAQLFTDSGAGVYTLVPDADLPGNAAGFTSRVIDISELDVATYPALVVGIMLQTADLAVTPAVDDILVMYRMSETELGGQNFSIHGTKNIGTDAMATPIYKFSTTSTTGADGEKQFSGLEFDAYHLTIPGAHDIAYGCGTYPIEHKAGIDTVSDLVFVPDEPHTLRLTVLDTGGTIIPGATVSLSRPGYNEIRLTGNCGQVFFVGAATAQVDFELQVTAPGYVTEVLPAVTIDGDVTMTVNLTSI